ncbi:MAG: hypothetical protein IKG35_01915, partial [Erysipelotrichaceae bacterium]|nr:hypothetical protein [Erysipelotrichaceae bacterium]
ASYFEYDISNNVKVTVYYVLIDGNESVNSIKIKRKTKDEWIMSPLKVQISVHRSADFGRNGRCISE